MKHSTNGEPNPTSGNNLEPCKKERKKTKTKEIILSCSAATNSCEWNWESTERPHRWCPIINITIRGWRKHLPIVKQQLYIPILLLLLFPLPLLHHHTFKLCCNSEECVILEPLLHLEKLAEWGWLCSVVPTQLPLPPPSEWGWWSVVFLGLPEHRRRGCRHLRNIMLRWGSEGNGRQAHGVVDCRRGVSEKVFNFNFSFHGVLE